MAAAVVLASVAADPVTFHTTPEADQVVHFETEQTIGSADGTLQPVDGRLTFDPDAPTAGLRGHFTVDMASIDTGIGLRDRDLRKKYLHTDTYPTAAFTLDDAQPTVLDTSRTDTLRLAVTGAMTLHGVTNDLPVRATLAPTSNGYDLQADFTILLTDFDIKPPKLLLQKVKDEVEVTVRLHLTRSDGNDP